MSRIDELIKEFCPSGVPYKPIGELGELVRGNGLQKSDFVEFGEPCVHYGQIYTKFGFSVDKAISYIPKPLFEKLRKAQPESLIITTTSENVEDVAKAIVWQGKTEVAFGGHSCSIKPTTDPRFLGYVLRTSEFQNHKNKFVKGTKVKEISTKSLAAIPVPVPPIEVQREIVSILDKFTALEAELEAELEARKIQYHFFLKKFTSRDYLEQFGFDDVELSKIGKTAMCKRIYKQETSTSGEIPFFKIGTFGDIPDAFISRELYEDYKNRFSYPRKGDVLLSASGTIGKQVIYDGTPSYFQDSNIIWLEHDQSKASNKWLHFVYQTLDWPVQGGTIARLYGSNFGKIKIPLPKISVQIKLSETLEYLERLIQANPESIRGEIAARRKQYEYYRDKLLTFKELDAA